MQKDITRRMRSIFVEEEKQSEILNARHLDNRDL